MEERSDAAALGGALRLTDLRVLVETVVEQAYDGVQGLCETLPSQSDAERWVVEAFSLPAHHCVTRGGVQDDQHAAAMWCKCHVSDH